jgi:hypothetical protein
MNRKRLQACSSQGMAGYAQKQMVLIMMALLPLLMVGMIVGTVYSWNAYPMRVRPRDRR